MLWAIIPVKSLHRSKSRLAGFLSAEDRAALTRVMLTRLLSVLNAVTQIDGVLVVSRDAAVHQIAAQFHVDVVAERVGSGLNGAVETGQKCAAAHGAHAVLILPSDLPCVQPKDIEALLGKTAVFPNSIVLCSDRHGQGTNALLLPVHLPFQFHYGSQSYQRHCAEAEKLQLPHHTVSVPGLQFDLDTRQDWSIYQENLLTVQDIVDCSC